MEFLLMNSTHHRLRKLSYKKTIFNKTDEIRSSDLLDFSSGSFNKFGWCNPSENKNGRTIKDESAIFITISKRKPGKKEPDRGKDFYDSVSQTFLKPGKTHRFCRFFDKRSSIAEQLSRTIPNFFKKPIVEKVNAS